ncbi:MAG: Trm112 family protein [Candidatus Lokiarchaeota archaeon]|nr:Trm112 family protein [Candidatus Lokiarchaeota archaeon]
MKMWLMDILACPAEDCRSKLNLEIYTQHEIKIDNDSVTEIDEALVTCPKCGRWYPVIDGIVCMLPDEQRLEGKQRIEETKFLEKWKGRIPTEILKGGKPFGIQEE